MKKLFILFASIGITLGSFAQQVPNGGFETWTDPTHPDDWSTYGNIAFPGVPGGLPYFAYKDTTAGNHVQGLASIRLVTDTVEIGPGQLATFCSATGLGSGIYGQQGPVFSGIAYTKRIDSLYFFVKYNPARPAKDTAVVYFDLTKNGVSLFHGGYGIGIEVPSTLNTWQQGFLPLAKNTTTYYSDLTTTPDTLHLSFLSTQPTDLDSASIGSTLWVDSVHFDASVNVSANGISEIGTITGVNAYPNPANNTVNIAVEQDEVGSQIQLFDMAGREVYNGTIADARMTIDTKNLQSGIYAIHVNSIDKLTTYKGKISIAH